MQKRLILRARGSNNRAYNVYDGRKVIGTIDRSSPSLYHAKYLGEFVGIYSTLFQAYDSIEAKARTTP